MPTQNLPIISPIEEGVYYRINGTKRVLYWDGEKWMLPVKNTRGEYFAARLMDKQPKVKSYERV